MGRIRAKGKEVIGGEEKVLGQKKRGRPLKHKEEINEDQVKKLEDEDSEDRIGVQDKKELESENVMQNGNKRQNKAQIRDKVDSVQQENGNGTRSNTEESTKSNSFRHVGSRRKNKPRRAAEAVVECN